MSGTPPPETPYAAPSRSRAAVSCVWAAAVVLAAACGCVSSLGLHREAASGEGATPPSLPEVAEGPVAYRLGPGDLVGVAYFRDYSRGGEPYRLDAHDTIFVTVQDMPECSREVTVLPDGTISLPRAGVVPARGKTLTELSEDLVEAYGKELRDPHVGVIAVKTQGKLDDFLESLQRNYTSRERDVEVGEDGTVNLPLVGDLAVGGLTLDQAQDAVAQRYAALFSDINVHVYLKQRTRARVAVLGEVHQPGVYPLAGQASPLLALALAGGARETADLSRVILVREGTEGGGPKVSVDLRRSGTASEERAPPFVQPSDVVFVPRSDIAEADLFVDQYIRRLIPFNFGVGAYYDITGGR